MRLTDLQLDMIRARRRRLTGDVWDHDDAEEIGDQLRRDLDDLLDEVDRLRAAAADMLAALRVAAIWTEPAPGDGPEKAEAHAAVTAAITKGKGL